MWFVSYKLHWVIRGLGWLRWLTDERSDLHVTSSKSREQNEQKVQRAKRRRAKRAESKTAKCKSSRRSEAAKDAKDARAAEEQEGAEGVRHARAAGACASNVLLHPPPLYEVSLLSSSSRCSFSYCSIKS